MRETGFISSLAKAKGREKFQCRCRCPVVVPFAETRIIKWKQVINSGHSPDYFSECMNEVHMWGYMSYASASVVAYGHDMLCWCMESTLYCEYEIMKQMELAMESGSSTTHTRILARVFVLHFGFSRVIENVYRVWSTIWFYFLCACLTIVPRIRSRKHSDRLSRI